MRNNAYDYSRAEDKDLLRRRKKFRRSIFFKKLRAILILGFIGIFGLSVLGLAVYAIYRSIADRNHINPHDYVLENPGPSLQLIEFSGDNTTNGVYTFNFDFTSHTLPENTEETESDDVIGSDYYTFEDGLFEKADEEESKGLIIIDAGHGGFDDGTSNSLNREKDLNLKIAYLVKDILLNRGYSVFLTRTDDVYIGLMERAGLANERTEALAMVSVHQNFYDEDASVHGVESWTYNRKGCRELAIILAEKVSSAVGAVNRGDRYATNLVVTSKTSLPSVIIECGYMSNPDEGYLLSTDDYQSKLAHGIADALDEFIKTYY